VACPSSLLLPFAMIAKILYHAQANKAVEGLPKGGLMKRNYDYIVLGCGGIGSGTAYWLARRAGREVLGLEQFALGHHNGGSQDHSRIIRLTYTYHHANYTALTPHTYTAWATLEEESAVQVVTQTGSVERV
jgi:sarcosine oxidase